MRHWLGPERLPRLASPNAFDIGRNRQRDVDVNFDVSHAVAERVYLAAGAEWCDLGRDVEHLLTIRFGDDRPTTPPRRHTSHDMEPSELGGETPVDLELTLRSRASSTAALLFLVPMESWRDDRVAASCHS